MTTVRPAALAAVVLVAAGLSGCVSLLPKTPPAQLYRFGDTSAAPVADCGGGRQTGVIVSPPDFPRASASDQMLTLSGDQAAYIGASRWVSPARDLFDDAVEAAFAPSCRVRLVRRQDFGAGAVRLRLDVARFEAVYPPGSVQAGKDAKNAKVDAAAPAPVVEVSVTATLMQRGGDFGAERQFKASAPAAENRVGAIVGAYSAATTQVLGQLVAWTEQQAPQIEAAEDSAHPAIDHPAPPLPGFAAPVQRERSTSTTTTTSSSQSPPPAPR